MIREINRPIYYITKDYAPELGDDYSNWNNIVEFIPNFQEWIWDQLGYYIRYNIRIRNINNTNEDKLISAFNTARKYNETCRNSIIDSVVTHLYVSELLLQILVIVFGGNWVRNHGYEVPGEDVFDVFDSDVKIKESGLSNSIHGIFYKNNLNSGNLKLKNYLLFCPELRKFVFESKRKIPKAIVCNESYGSTGGHKNDETYHQILFNSSNDYNSLLQSGYFNAEAEMKNDFPELEKYDISNHSRFSVEQQEFADDFISITRDPAGNTFALAFGQSDVQKQRDIEIRFAIIFTLGSLGRYRPWVWGCIEESKPLQYYAIKNFLEYNYMIFPYLILCYLSGKYFTFKKKAVYS